MIPRRKRIYIFTGIIVFIASFVFGVFEFRESKQIGFETEPSALDFMIADRSMTPEKIQQFEYSGKTSKEIWKESFGTSFQKPIYNDVPLWNLIIIFSLILSVISISLIHLIWWVFLDTTGGFRT